MRTDPRSSHYQTFWNEVRAQWKHNSTLQSLAIRSYIDYLEKEEITTGGATITERSLKRDLELAREWESNTSEDEKTRRGRWHGGTIGDLSITWYSYSDGWKVRAKEKAARKQGEEIKSY